VTFHTDDAHFPNMRELESQFLKFWFVHGEYARTAMLSAQMCTAATTRVEPVLIEPTGSMEKPPGRIFWSTGNYIELYTGALKAGDGTLANSCPSCLHQLKAGHWRMKRGAQFAVAHKIYCGNKACKNPFRAPPGEAREPPQWLSFNGHIGPTTGGGTHRLLWDAPFPLPRLYPLSWVQPVTADVDADDESGAGL
jgi:hypothetical protein